MSYTALARRYRSQGFEEVVGQEAIAQTLTNAIERDRVAHAYLFVGTRGVGKTSMARIFAKALNGGTPEVDAAIMRGEDTDVIEIDAASNRRVEDARDIIANCVYTPMRGKLKIYIIDEVHMLTKDAFNTLLKVMEEPPAYVKFILCTTEPNKVLPTVQSRCQRFDFRNIAGPEIAAHLARVVEQEGINATPGVLAEVARLANGSMRDGLSLLDRLLAAVPQGDALDEAVLERVLGLPQRALVTDLVNAIATGEPGGALVAADAILSKGNDAEQLIDALVVRLRDLMLLCACGMETPLIETVGDARSELAAQAGQFDTPSLIHMIALAESVQRLCKQSSTPRALVDAMIARLALTGQVAQAAGLLAGASGGDTLGKR